MSKQRVLIIDDEVKFTRLLKESLEQTGTYEVHVEHRGAHDLAATRACRPDVVRCLKTMS